MAEDQSDAGPLDDLLEQMPRIAEAVKAFPEAVQPQAFEALMAEARGATAGSSRGGGGAARRPRRRNSKPNNTPGSDGERKARRKRTNPSQVRDLDLTPSGKQSLKAFVAEKEPKTQNDQNAVSVYYLAEVLGVSPVTIDHVFTCYKEMHWREPADLANSLAITAARKRFVDTADMDDIKITPAGRNHVRHDLPAKKE